MAGGIWAIVVAGGDARRFGRPKQFALLGGRPLLAWSVDAARTVADEVVLVLPAPSLEDPEARAGCAYVVAGGATRADSVRAGLAAVPPEVEVVLVHDAARPLASPGLFTAVTDAVLAGADGAVPGLPVVDTVKRVGNGRVLETLSRDDLVAVQTPQAFRAETLRRAHAGAGQATDDAALVESIGGAVVVVSGEVGNLKVTDPEDLARLELSIAAKAEVPPR